MSVTVRAIPGLPERVDSWLLEPAPPERLALLRILCGGFGVAYVVGNFGEFQRVSGLPTSAFEPVGLAGLLSGPLSAAILWVLYGVLIVSGIAFTTGRAFAVSGPIFAAAFMTWGSYHSSWGQMLHFEHLLTLHLLVLGLSPAADALVPGELKSGEAQSAQLTGRRRSGNPASLRYGWPIRLMALITASTYVIAGIAKVRIAGLEWLNTATLQNHIAYSASRMDLLGAYEPPLARLVVGRGWLTAAMAVGAMTVEFSAPFALVSRRFRNVWVVAVLLLHAGIAATMLVWFGYNGFGFALLPFFHIERIPHWILRRRS